MDNVYIYIIYPIFFEDVHKIHFEKKKKFLGYLDSFCPNKCTRVWFDVKYINEKTEFIIKYYTILNIMMNYDELKRTNNLIPLHSLAYMIYIVYGRFVAKSIFGEPLTQYLFYGWIIQQCICPFG